MIRSTIRLEFLKRTNVIIAQVRRFVGITISGENERQVESDGKSKAGVEEVPNKHVVLSVVCDGVDGSNSIILSSPPKSYSFNFGEGFQMAGASFGKATRADKFTEQHMFVTHASWKNLGGILGYLQGHRYGQITHTLHGPAHYKEILNSLKRTTTAYLSDVHDMKLNIMKPTRTYFEDSQVRIEYVKLSGESMNVFGNALPKLAFAYIVKPKRCAQILNSTHFNAEKLVDYNIKWGPMTTALKKGESITLEDGRVVTLKDVLSEDLPKYETGSIVVLECPSELYLDSLLSAQEFIDLPSDPEWSPDLIVHMSPKEIVSNDKYRSFIKRFSKNTTHLMLNENSAGRFCPFYNTYRKALTEWNHFMFPAIKRAKQITDFEIPKPGKELQGFAGQHYIYRLKKWNVIQPSKNVEVFRPVKRRNPNARRQLASANEFPEIVFLGTGSSMPHTVRNVMGILVQMRKDEYIMLDCGENSLRQMNKLYGKRATAVLQNLKAIFISHKHYDHLGGVPAILDEWNKVTQGLEPALTMQLLCPIEMKEIMYTYQSLLGGKLDRVKIVYHNPLFVWTDSRQKVTPRQIENMEALKATLGLDEYHAVVVPHQQWFKSYGIVMKHKAGWKLVYSGDTAKQCHKLIELGKDCDILIHEATFPDHLEQTATKHGHCTFAQAIENGKAMNAKYTILTHFSGKHAKAAYTAENVGVSFDLMKFRPSQSKELSEMELEVHDYNDYKEPDNLKATPRPSVRRPFNTQSQGQNRRQPANRGKGEPER